MSGAVERVRPKMMTVVAIMAGLLPIMWSHGTGAKVIQRADDRHPHRQEGCAGRRPSYARSASRLTS